MPENKHFEKGDILKFADVGPGVNESTQSGNCWLVIELATIMDSSGMMHNEYVLLHKAYETYYFIDQVDRKEAETCDYHGSAYGLSFRVPWENGVVYDDVNWKFCPECGRRRK